jgi:hypothetical protein
MNEETTKLQNRVAELERIVKELSSNYEEHRHDGANKSKKLSKTIELDRGEFLRVGLGGMATGPLLNQGSTSEQVQFATSVGKSDGRSGFVNKADILQVDYLHQPRNTNKQSFIVGRRTPVVVPLESTSISVTSGGNTVTITGYNFTTNELANAVISIYNSSGTLIESRLIASNTSTVITISGTWGATTSNGSFGIYAPVFFGSADTVWQRFYTQEGTAGGIRFGMGVTAGAQNQNGLLYMDATGDLYWRNKSGTAVKLN